MARLVPALTASVLLALLATLAPAAWAAEDAAGLRDQLAEQQRERSQREEELSEVREQAGDARSRLERAEADLTDAQRALAQREAELEAARAELAQARAAAEEAREQLRRVEERLARTEAALAAEQGKLDRRVRAAFKYGNVSFTETLTSARDMGDFLSSTAFVGQVMANDKALVEEVAALLAQVERQRTEAQSARADSEREAARARSAAAEVEQATEDQRRLTRQVTTRREAHEEALAALQQDAAAISEHIHELEVAEDEVRAQIAEAERQAQQRLEAERARQRREAEQRQERADAGGGAGGGSPGTSGGSSHAGVSGPTSTGWLRPVAGRSTSSYGYRVHPVTGGRRLHAGVDLAAASGTPVRAARDGVVGYVGWMSGYGNTVMISHGDGLVTLYAHLSSLAVGRGAYVEQGAHIGGVGMTGTATGPHVHFEVRVGGVPRDPCGYVSC